MSNKILGLDLGEKKVGVAISDNENIISFPRDIIKYLNFEELIKKIREICDKETISKIIIGLPLSLKGKETEQTKKVQNQGEEISKTLGIPVDFIDERYTSVIPENLMLTEKKKHRQKPKDDIAAQKILQTYLDKYSK